MNFNRDKMNGFSRGSLSPQGGRMDILFSPSTVGNRRQAVVPRGYPGRAPRLCWGVTVVVIPPVEYAWPQNQPQYIVNVVIKIVVSVQKFFTRKFRES